MDKPASKPAARAIWSIYSSTTSRSIQVGSCFFWASTNAMVSGEVLCRAPGSTKMPRPPLQNPKELRKHFRIIMHMVQRVITQQVTKDTRETLII
jgi:hypothetical protein